MSTAEWIAALGIALPVYAYLGYPVALFLLAAMVQMARDVTYLLRRDERRARPDVLPNVSIILSAFDEEQVIERTLEHCLALDYPAERLEVLVGTDGCTDRTAELARGFDQDVVHVLDFPERRGKVSVITDCAAQATGDVLVFTDANTLLESSALKSLIRHFRDPGVGAVCGELRLRSADGAPADEGVYWRYEMVLKILESRLNAVLGANGAIYAVRREVFPQVGADIITDDFVILMKVRAGGHRVIYDPEAWATEECAGGVQDEFRRRVRIGAGNFQALRECASLLAPWKGAVAFSFWSHKVLRWLTPFLLPAALAANFALLSSPFWLAVLGAQFVVYGAALAGGALGVVGVRIRPLRALFYFAVINVALAVGLVRGAAGLQRAAWRRTGREPVEAGGK